MFDYVQKWLSTLIVVGSKLGRRYTQLLSLYHSTACWKTWVRTNTHPNFQFKRANETHTTKHDRGRSAYTVVQRSRRPTKHLPCRLENQDNDEQMNSRERSSCEDTRSDESCYCNGEHT